MVGLTIERVLARYGQRPGLALCYGQGSVLSGFTTSSDLDLIMVWAGELPSGLAARELTDPGSEPVRFDGWLFHHVAGEVAYVVWFAAFLRTG